MKDNLKSVPKLLTHEWIAVLSILGLLFFISCIVALSNYSSKETLPPHYLVDQKIEVFIEGAVENPGVYEIDKGTSIKEVLEKAKPLKEASLKKINLERKLKKKWQVITIPKMEMITVYVQGAIENVGPINIPKGSTLNDLCAYLQCKPHADIEKLKRKRRLKPSETITVPSK